MNPKDKDILAVVNLLVFLFNAKKESYPKLPDEEKQQILAIVNSHQDVFGAHDIRTRQGGKIKFIQMHLELEDSLSLIRAHQVADEVEALIQTHFDCEMDVLMHLDPLSVVNKTRQSSAQN